jgi:hypothetical protein
MVIAPITPASAQPTSFVRSYQGRELSGDFGSGVSRVSQALPGQGAAAADFSAKLDQMIEQMRLDGERLLMFGERPEDSEESADADLGGDTADFSTYQMVLEAGRKQVSQTGFVPESTLRLFA